MPRFLNNLLAGSKDRQPMVVVVMFDLNDNPLTAFVEEAPSVDAVGFYQVHGDRVYVEYTMTNFKYTEQAPNGGGGLRRTIVNFDLINVGDDQTLQMYESSVEPTIWRELFVGGASLKDYYFEVFALDRSKQQEDLENGLQLGTYFLAPTITWSESSPQTSLTLYDALLEENSYAGATNDRVSDIIYIYNPWFDGNAFPTAYGQIPRVRLFNGTPAVDSVTIRQGIAGVCTADQSGDSPDGDIFLAEAPFEDAPELYGLVDVDEPPTVLVSFPRGDTTEVIKGRLAFTPSDLNRQNIVLTDIERNQPYSTGVGYAFTDTGEKPENWGIRDGLGRSPAFRYFDKSTVVNARDIIAYPTGFMEVPELFWFYDPDPMDSVNSWKEENRIIQLNGFGAEEFTITHEIMLSRDIPDLDKTNISMRFRTEDNNDSDPTTPRTDLGGAMFYTDQYITLRFYISDKRLIDTSQTYGEGANWGLLNIESETVIDTEFRAYYKLTSSNRLTDRRIYVEGDGRLIKVPEERVTAINYNVSAFGTTGLAEVVLSALPTSMGIGATSNVLYADVLYESSNVRRTDRIVRDFIQDNFDFAGSRLGTSWTTFQDENIQPFPWIGFKVDGTEKAIDVLDRLAFQCSFHTIWRDGKLEITPTNFPARLRYEIINGPPPLPGLAIRNSGEILANDMYLDDSASVTIGKMQTFTSPQGFETGAMFLEIGFGSWEDPFAPLYTSQTRKTIPKGYYKYQYNFDLIQDGASLGYAVALMLSAGHASGFATVEKTFTHNCDYGVLENNVMDMVEWKQFPYFTDRTDRLLDITSGLYSFPEDLDFVVKGFMQIRKLELTTSKGAFNVQVTAKMSFLFNPAITSIPWLELPPIDVPEPPDETPEDPEDPPATPPGGPVSGNDYPGWDAYGCASGFYKKANVSFVCDPTDCRLDSDDGLVVDMNIVVEDIFYSGFTANFGVVEGSNDDLTPIGSLTVPDGDNTGNPINQTFQFVITGADFGSFRTFRRYTVVGEFVYTCTGHEKTRTYNFTVTMAKPPGFFGE